MTLTGGTPTATGRDASAVANMISDGSTNGTFKVASITITGPGDYSVDPTTVNFLGGGQGSVAATAGAITTAAATSGGLTKSGSGTLTLGGGYNYQGPTVVRGGTLSLNAALPTPTGAGSLVVSNATLALSLNGGGSTIPASNVTFQGNSVLTLNYGNVFVTPVTAINASTNLVQSGSTVINITGIGLGTGVFPLITYTGASVPTNNFTLGSLPPGITGVLTNSGGNTLSLLITAAGQLLFWRAADSNNVPFTTWDLNTSMNWNAGTAKYLQYSGNTIGDNVTFDDTVFSAGTNVTLNSTLVPATVNFDSTLPYSITGSGGIAGVTSVNITNTGSVFLGTSNSYMGGTVVGGGSTLIITNNSALGTNTGGVTLAGSTLQVNGNTTSAARAVAVTANSSVGVAASTAFQLGGVLSGSASLTKIDNGTFSLSASNTFSGLTTIKLGTLQVTAGAYGSTNANIEISPTAADAGTLTVSGGTVSADRVIISGISANAGTFGPAVVNQSGGTINSREWFTVGSGANGGSSGSGVFNMSGGTLNVHSQQMEVGNFTATDGTVNMSGSSAINIWNNQALSLGANNNANSGTFNQNGGTVTLYSDAGVTPGGTGVFYIGRAGTLTGGFTNNLNAGTLVVPQVQGNTANAATRVFNFNGGTLKASKNNTTFMFGLTAANVLTGGAVIDSSSNNITISQALLSAGAGGLTKQGTGILTLTGTNNYSGPTIVSGGTLLVQPGHQAPNSVSLSSGTTFGIVLPGPLDTVTNGGLSLAAGTTTLSFGLGTNGNPSVPLLYLTGAFNNAGTFSVALGGNLSLGAIPLVRYGGGSTIGSFNSTIAGPQGASVTLSNGVGSSTLYAVVTSLGSGITWTGTNPVLTNVWDLNTTTNWSIAGSPTRYNEIVPPGDAVTFNDAGNSLVLLSNTASPANMTISNAAVNYTFQGSGHVSGSMTLTKRGTGTATMSYAGNDYTGDTVVSNGTFRLGVANAIPDGAGKGNVTVAGTLDLNTFSDTINGLSGGGTVDTVAGGTPTLTVGGNNASSTFSGLLQNTAGTLGLTKTGTGTLTLTSSNSHNGSTIVSSGTLVITNNATINASSASTLQVGNVNGQSGALYQSAGTAISVTNVGLGGTSIGSAAGAYGYYNMSGGTLSFGGEIDVGGSGGGAGTFGQFDMSGGTAFLPDRGADNGSYFLPNRGAVGESSVVNISGGTVAVANGATPTDSPFNGLSISFAAGSQTNATTISGTGQFLTPSLTVKLNQGSAFNAAGNAANITTMNLNGGLLQTLGFRNGTAANNVGVRLNFNGGTVKAGIADNAAFITNLAGVYIRSGGATIDDNGRTITIGQGLLAPTGDGISSITLSSGGAGYIVPPQVIITDGTGTGATAYAVISGGVVTGIVVTSPGNDYSASPTVTLAGGGFTSAATIDTVSVAANASGGLVKTGVGKLILPDPSNTYTGLTTVSNGTLQVDGTIPGAVTVKSGATLGGNGTIGGVVTVQAGGTIGAGASIGTLTLNSSPVLGGSVVVEINNSGPVNDKIVVAGNPVTYGGTLVVNNVGLALTTNDVFTLFTATGHSGSFTTITGIGTPLDPGLGYRFTNGVLSVVTVPTTATNPTNITSVVTGGTNLALSWPADHLGWTLQKQTNSRAIGLKTNWFDITGSASMTATNFVIDKNDPTVFYRLRYTLP